MVGLRLELANESGAISTRTQSSFVYGVSILAARGNLTLLCEAFSLSFDRLTFSTVTSTPQRRPD
jgi:hypothetical protein